MKKDKINQDTLNQDTRNGYRFDEETEYGADYPATYEETDCYE